MDVKSDSSEAMHPSDKLIAANIMHANTGLFLCTLCFVVGLAGCAHKTVAVAPGKGGLAQDQSYVDLKNGDRLRIVVPLVKSGGYQPQLQEGTRTGATITLSAADLIGYGTYHYAVRGNSKGVVRLQFVSAEASRDGKTVAEAQPPQLPFALPDRAAHIRLIYFIRVSRADHNMAMIAARQMAVLDAFTAELKQNPDVCGSDKKVFCSWVPAGVAVRPES